MTANVQKFNYNGNSIAFQLGENVMVNATEMAKPFNKRPAKWLELPSTKDFISALVAIRKSDSAIIQTQSGGINGGGCTWFHEDVALEFARWLSPAFAIWCNDRIKELLRYGITATQVTVETIIANPETGIKLLQALQEERREKELLRQRSEAQSEQLKLSAPKVQYFDTVLTSTNTYTATQVAKEFGYGAETLNRKLCEMGIHYKQNGQWLLKAKYQGRGYTKTITRTYTRSHGTTGLQMQTVWTEKGRLFIHELLNV